jgi:hypothetical protein
VRLGRLVLLVRQAGERRRLLPSGFNESGGALFGIDVRSMLRRSGVVRHPFIPARHVVRRCWQRHVVSRSSKPRTAHVVEGVVGSQRGIFHVVRSLLLGTCPPAVVYAVGAGLLEFQVSHGQEQVRL